MYLSMAAWFADQNLPGMAAWMRKQAKEEQTHAMKFYDFLYERGANVELEAIAKPPITWNSPLAVFQEAYSHEQKVTKMIEDIYFQAKQENDPATEVMLHWFIDEQVEEEDSALNIVEQLKMIGDSKQGILMLDHQLGKRE